MGYFVLMRSKIKVVDVLNVFNHCLSVLFILLFAVIAIIGIYAIFDSFSVIERGKEIEEAAKIIADADDLDRVKKLKETNPDVVAWIKIDNTDIDYPVTQTSNNTFYLNHNFKKESSLAGSIFADYRNKLAKDKYVVTYGHNMSGHSMFGYLNMFNNKTFFDSHTKGKYYLENDVYDLEVLSYAIIDNNTQEINDIDAHANKPEAVLKFFKERGRYTRDVKTDRLLLLSTCYSDTSKRVVLLTGYNE